MPFAATWMETRVYNTKQSQKEKGKYRVLALTCGIQNTAQMNLSMK